MLSLSLCRLVPLKRAAASARVRTSCVLGLPSPELLLCASGQVERWPYIFEMQPYSWKVSVFPLLFGARD